MPYAAKAIIQHEFIIDLLDVYIEFRHPMNQTVKPADVLWVVYLDGVETAITSSVWLDQFTMLLTIEALISAPDRVTVAYDGPDPLLITAWDKQWEPWAPIVSFTGTPTMFKYGMIILWYGSVATIPTGWYLCNGENNTPDLRDKFVIGVGNTYNPAATGGNLTHTHAATQAAHTHTFAFGQGMAAGNVYGFPPGTATPVITVPSTNHLPPYYALCYIMKG